MPIRSFHDLHVWQRSVSLVEQTYAVIRVLPAEERPVLGDQMRRASMSIPANIGFVPRLPPRRGSKRSPVASLWHAEHWRVSVRASRRG